MALEGMQLGRYKLQNLLGGGGMGKVYLAEDVHIRRQVAVKVIRAEAASYPDPQASQEAERLFRREVRAIAMLDHPHILPLYDYGEETLNNLSLTYMVMPLRQGGSLATWLQQRGGYAKLSLQDYAVSTCLTTDKTRRTGNKEPSTTRRTQILPHWSALRAQLHYSHRRHRADFERLRHLLLRFRQHHPT